MTGELNRALRGALDAALAADGLTTRGALHEGGRTIALVGHAGASYWPHFSRWRTDDPQPDAPDPLDRWSRAVVEAVAVRFGVDAVFPFDRPYPPFQSWAMQAEGLRASPLGILIHPDYGPWHAYRGALVFDCVVGIDPVPQKPHPCDTCPAKPCLTTCPVGAFDGKGFNPVACRSYLALRAGAACMGQRCAARLACPVGQEHAYPPGQQRFHMAAFASA